MKPYSNTDLLGEIRVGAEDSSLQRCLFGRGFGAFFEGRCYLLLLREWRNAGVVEQ
ncbi:hypothetical protein LINGRAHAP2_LOCUS24806 [Linum grandiflorum]